MLRRTSIELEDELIEEARKALGTNGFKETVERALTETVRAARRRRLAERLRTGEGLDFSEEVIRNARWRVFGS